MDTEPAPNAVSLIASDPDVFEAFYREHVRAVSRFAARRVSDPQEAADTVADVFLAAIDSAHTYDPERAAPQVWLFGIGRNVLAAHARQRARQLNVVRRLGGRRMLDADSQTRIEERIDAERYTRALYRALASLSPHDRLLVELVAVDGLAVAEAARTLGIKPATARVRYHRARMALQDTLHGSDGPAATAVTLEA